MATLKSFPLNTQRSKVKTENGRRNQLSQFMQKYTLLELKIDTIPSNSFIIFENILKKSNRAQNIHPL